jgi:hypothetical protein
MNYLKSFEANEDLISRLGKRNAYLVWVMALYTDYPDFLELASEALTDGSDDKKIDFIRLDVDGKKLVFAQGYFSSKDKDQAPANKASDLNTAAAWLFSGDLSAVPENLRAIIQEARDAIYGGEVDQIDLLYIHNLPESVNVSRELQTAAEHLKAALKDSEAIMVTYRELGIENIERLYLSKESTLLVTENIECPAKPLSEEKGEAWRALVVSLPGAWLREQFHKYGDDLFSANYRGFLGIGKRRKINSAIRSSAETTPIDFWVLNNGITILTTKADPRGSRIILSGMSIINGAQTTGSIGSVDSTKHPLTDLTVMCRIIESADADVIARIIKYNNTQNEITTWDQYSNSAEQKRIAKEFADLGHSYSLKRGYEASDAELGIEVLAQALISIEGSYREANRGKNAIFDRGHLYRQAFDLKKARHILFVYALSRAVDEQRIELKRKESESSIIEIEKAQLALFRNLRFKYFFISVMGACLEQILGEPVDLREISFQTEFARRENKSLNDLVALCHPVVSITLAYVASVLTEDLSAVMKRMEGFVDLSRKVGSLIYASQVAGPAPAITSFREALSAKG